MSKNMNVPKLRFSEFGGEWLTTMYLKYFEYRVL